MTQIKVTMRNGEMEIYAVGHAKDPIACASVSAIMETAVLGLQAVADLYPDQVQIKINDRTAIKED
jgi:uncharacterized protein YsxB (DUF464 family)